MDELTAILTATRTDAIHNDDGSYLDWSSYNGDGTVDIEIGDGNNAVQIRVDLKELVHRMAATLLAADLAA